MCVHETWQTVAQSATRSCMAAWLCMVVHGVTARCRVKRNRQLHGCSKDTAAAAVCGAARKGTGGRIGKGTGVILIGVSRYETKPHLNLQYNTGFNL